MEALKRKWNSRRGASILLALLFLLVCMMVGASVVMAAASNVGKTDSIKKEQQKYLTLSSALNMLCGELANVQYVGRYDYVQEDCDHYIYVDADGTVLDGYVEGAETLKDADGNAITVHDQHRTYTQTMGELKRINDGGSLTDTWVDSVLLLRNDLDWIFANQFEMPVSRQIDGDLYTYISLLDNPNPEVELAEPEESCTLTFTVKLNPDEQQIYGDLSRTVQIIVEMWEDGRIELTATLMNGEDPTEYVTTAVLKPVEENWQQDLLILSNHNGNKAERPTGAVTWKREHIAKGEGGGSE